MRSRDRAMSEPHLAVGPDTGSGPMVSAIRRAVAPVRTMFLAFSPVPWAIGAASDRFGLPHRRKKGYQMINGHALEK